MEFNSGKEYYGAQGATEAEALANIQDAILEYLAAARQLAGEQFLREVEIPAESRAEGSNSRFTPFES